MSNKNTQLKGTGTASKHDLSNLQKTTLSFFCVLEAMPVDVIHAASACWEKLWTRKGQIFM